MRNAHAYAWAFLHWSVMGVQARKNQWQLAHTFLCTYVAIQKKTKILTNKTTKQ